MGVVGRRSPVQIAPLGGSARFAPAYNQLIATFASDLASGSADSAAWDFLGIGTFIGIPFNMICVIVVGVAMHLYLTRVRSGVHVMAVGSSRKAARHAGIDVKRSIFLADVFSGMLASAGGLLYAARQNSAGTDTGVGWEVNALAAAVLGGISLAGGRGTISRALMGAAIIFLLINGLVQLGTHGSLTTATIGFILLAAVAFNVKFVKNKGKLLQKIYVSPSLVEFQMPPSIQRDSGTPYAENDYLKDVEAIALGRIEGPEDVLLDRDDHLYTVNRNGSIIRFLAPNYTEREEFARIGGRPLGLAIDRDENILACVAGMGVYGVRPDRSVFKVTDETDRTWNRPKDDSRLWLADDLDIAPDGKIYFSDATTRYDLSDWALDGFEGRGNGRLICHDPSTGKTRTILNRIPFPNGVCLSHDAKSVLWASTWLCKIYRYWIAGEKAGTYEVLVDNCQAIPITSTVLPTGRTGLPWLESVRQSTTLPWRIRTSGCGWLSRYLPMSGSVPESISAASSSSTTKDMCLNPSGIRARSHMRRSPRCANTRDIFTLAASRTIGSAVSPFRTLIRPGRAGTHIGRRTPGRAATAS